MKEIFDLRIRDRKLPEGRMLSSRFAESEIKARFDHPSGLFRVLLAGSRRLESLAEDIDGSLYGWAIDRRYNHQEIARAEIFRLIITRAFEPGGAECGTEYDLSRVCSICGAGRRQVSELRLDLRKLPKRGGIAQSIDNEIVVSQRTAECLAAQNLTGFDLRPIHHREGIFEGPVDLRRVPSGRRLLERAKSEGVAVGSWQFWVWLNRPEQSELSEVVRAEGAKQHGARCSTVNLPVWYQIVPSSEVTISMPGTHFGMNPLDEDPQGQYRCPNGHTLGFNILSEASLSRESWDGSDFCRSGKLIGRYPAPYPLLFVSSAFLHALLSESVKGFKFEVAHFVE